jgi:hypothetical protein
MTPNAKTRLIWSPVGGVAIPTAYFFLLLLFDRFFHIFVSPAGPWLAMPLGWPAFFYDLLVPPSVVHSDLEMPDMSGLGISLLLVVVGNFVLYSLLTYLMIRRKQMLPRLR